MIVLDFAPGRVGCILRVTAGAQRGSIQQGTAIQVKDEHRRFRRGGVNFIQRRHAPFRKLELAPTAHDPNPLTGWCALRLFLEHTQCVSE